MTGGHPDEGSIHQDVRAGRDGYAAAGDMTININYSPAAGEAAERSTGSTEGPSRVARVLNGHRTWYFEKKLVSNATFSPSGKLLATSAFDDDTVILWYPETGQRRGSLTHYGGVERTAFSADGQLIATGGPEKVVKIWDVSSGSPVHVITHARHIHGIAFSPDGRQVATGADDNVVRFWEVGAWRSVNALYPRSHSEYYNGIWSLKFSPDGRLIAAGTDGTAHVWDTASGSLLYVLPAPGKDCEVDVSFSPDGQLLATGSSDGIARLWDVGSGTLVHTLAGRSHWSVAFSPDGRLLAVGGQDGAVRLWGVKTQQFERTLVGHGRRVPSVAFNPDGLYLASASVDGTVRLWT